MTKLPLRCLLAEATWKVKLKLQHQRRTRPKC